VNDEDLARALASYVGSIVSGNSPFDRYVNGEVGALSDRARRDFERWAERSRSAFVPDIGMLRQKLGLPAKAL